MLAVNVTQFYSADQRVRSATEDMKTSFEIKGNYSSFLPLRNQHTEISEDYQHSHVIISESDRIAQKKTIGVSKPRKNQVSGTVLEMDKVTVKCEVCSNNQNRIINLPTALFKDHVTIGMPFTVFLDETSGYRRLLVKDRAINEEIRQKGNDEMAALVNEL